MRSVRIDRRFCGPPDSGNGGYSCGLLGPLLGGPAEVTLRKPPPLDRAMQVVEVGEGLELRDGETLIASAREATLTAEAPPPPTLTEAELQSTRYPAFEGHVFPTCFVCGPERPAGDGLRIFVGPAEEGEVWAAPFTPTLALPNDAGVLRPEVVWAALDCPGYFAVDRGQNAPALLGRMTAQVFGDVEATSRLILVAWPMGQEGRKLFAGTALYTTDGKLLAQSKQVWIRLRDSS